MSRRARVLMLILLVLPAALLSACGEGDEATSQDPLKGWIDYTAPDGSFSLRLPQQPEVQEQTIQTAEGPVTLIMYVVEGDEGAWLVSANAMPPLTAQAISSGDEQTVTGILQGGRDGALANIQATLESEKDVEVQGNRGLEIYFGAPGDEDLGIDEIKGAARIVLVGTTLYQVIVMATPEGMDDTVQPYLDSFRPETR